MFSFFFIVPGLNPGLSRRSSKERKRRMKTISSEIFFGFHSIVSFIFFWFDLQARIKPTVTSVDDQVDLQSRDLRDDRLISSFLYDRLISWWMISWLTVGLHLWASAASLFLSLGSKRQEITRDEPKQEKESES